MAGNCGSEIREYVCDGDKKEIERQKCGAEAAGNPSSATFSGLQYLDRKKLSGRLTTYLSQCFGIGMSRAQVILPTCLLLSA